MAEQKAYHKEREQKLLENASKALSDIPEESKPTARAARTQLVNWLTSMHAKTQDPALLSTDSMANTGANALLQYCSEHKSKQTVAFAKAFNGLADGDQLNVIRYLIAAALRGEAQAAFPVTRADTLWNQTGFFIDGTLKTVCAKVGSAPFQPIGFDDETHYVGTEGSKLLWASDWGMALVLPFDPPFHVERHEVFPQEVGTDDALSQKERELMNEVIASISEDLDAHARAQSDDERTEICTRMRDSIKFYSLRLPRLDKKLDEITDENPEAGADFQNVDPVGLSISISEYLHMLMDEDSAAQKAKATELVVELDEEELAKKAKETEAFILQVCEETAALTDEVAKKAAIDNALIMAFTSIPNLKEHLGDTPDKTHKVFEKVLEVLRGRAQ